MASRKGKRIQRPRIQPEMQAGLEQATGLTVVVWPIGDVKPYARNPRVEHDVAKIALSIREIGWTQQIVVDEEGVILAGHGRRLAAMQLGLDVVPVTQVFGLSEWRKKAYRLMDNRSGEDSSWEKYLLIAELREIDEQMSIRTRRDRDSPTDTCSCHTPGSLLGRGRCRNSGRATVEVGRRGIRGPGCTGYRRDRSARSSRHRRRPRGTAAPVRR